MFWKLVYGNIEHRPVRAALSTLLIAVPVALLLTVAGLRPVLVKDTKVFNGGSAVSRTTGPSPERFTPTPAPESPFRQAPANPLVAVSFVYCFAVIVLSMHGAVLQRTREIGILRSMGASKFFVMRIVLAEAVLFGLGGAVLGAVLSQGMREALTNLGLAASRHAVTWAWWPFTVCAVVGAAILGACYPCITAARLNVVDALAYDD